MPIRPPDLPEDRPGDRDARRRDATDSMFGPGYSQYGKAGVGSPPPIDPAAAQKVDEILASTGQKLETNAKLQQKGIELADKLGNTLKIGALLAIERMNKAIGGVITRLEGIVKAGMQGTFEFEQMNQSFLRFARSVADIFAPLIRGMTFGFEALRMGVLGFSSEAKSAIMALAITIGVTSAAVTALISLLVVGATLVVAFGGPVAAVIAVISAAILVIPAAIVAIRASFVGWEETLREILTIILDIGLEIAALLTDWSALGQINSRPLVDAIMNKKNGLTPNSYSQFESGRGTYERIQGGIRGGATIDDLNEKLKGIWDEAKEANKKKETVLGGGSGFGAVTPADQGFDAALGYGFTI